MPAILQDSTGHLQHNFNNAAGATAVHILQFLVQVVQLHHTGSSTKSLARQSALMPAAPAVAQVVCTDVINDYKEGMEGPLMTHSATTEKCCASYTSDSPVVWHMTTHAANMQVVPAKQTLVHEQCM